MRLITKPDALRQLEARISAASKGADPAPWFDETEAVQAWGGDPRQHKLQAATKVGAIAALLSGDIVAVAEVEGEARPVPSWAWAFASWSLLQINWPVRLPDAEAHWRGTLPTHFDCDGFERWLSGYVSQPIAPHDLPPSFEPPPPYAERRPMPDTGTVTLGECVSWVAWQFSLSGLDMLAAVDQGEFGPAGEREMREAFARVLAKAKSEELHLHGRFQADHRGGKEGSRKLNPPDLMDFARFNPMVEGLECGTRYAWDGTALEALFAEGGGFVDIEVFRDQVLSAFPNPLETLRPPLNVVPHLVTGTPGRPSSKSIFMAMFRERLASGDFLPTVTAEAREVAQQFNADPAYSKWPRVTGKTVKNSIAAEYRSARK